MSGSHESSPSVETNQASKQTSALMTTESVSHTHFKPATSLKDIDAPTMLKKLQDISDILSGFEAFQNTTQGDHFEQLKFQSLSLIQGKLLPELQSGLSLPLFVSIIGGSNTGKSTLFNALARRIISEAKITAGATKHPLIYIHQQWKDLMMQGDLFVSPEILENSAQLLLASEQDHTYLSFHQRDELKDIALIDCPDFDSVYSDNEKVAMRVVNHSDLCIFVTNPHKYKDAVLVDSLQHILQQGKQVFVLFNMTDDEMLYRTMLDDLKSIIPHQKLSFGTYLPTIETADPERVLQTDTEASLHAFFLEQPHQQIKVTLLQHQVHAVVERCQDLLHQYKDQTERKDELLFQMQSHFTSVLTSYEQNFNLTFPELSAALNQHMIQIELQRVFKPKVSDEIEKPQWTTFLAHGFGLAGQKLRSAFVRSFQIEAPPKDWKIFWQQRDEQDLAHLQQRQQILRASIEQSLRSNGEQSAVSLLLLQQFFTAEALQQSDQDLQEAFWTSLSKEKSIAQEILEQSEKMNQKGQSFWLQSAAWLANGMKLCVGLFLAWLTAGFGFWDLIFLPAGFIAGAYGITWLIHARLQHKQTLFKNQRVRMAKELLEHIQIKPMKQCIQQMSNRQDLGDLSNLSKQLQALI